MGEQLQIALDDSPQSLALLDHALGEASKDDRRRLENACGLYLGTVIVGHQPHAQWRVWPNGRLVVLLAPGREFDVVAAVHDQAAADQPTLADLYADAAR